MKNIIIGLSGHIDHGKTSFVKMINDYDGDKRSDEIERGMTIDVSFSNVILGENHISFIDVPGHLKLIKNMISGAFGVDMIALIIACDDGIMPQTLEHLQIARLLGIDKILVFLSKSDLVGEAKIASLTQEVKDLFESLQLQPQCITSFSIYNKDSINHIKEILTHLDATHRQYGGFFRYYCDRVFSKQGFGTIVTGTILGGEINKNDKIFLCDKNKEVTIRTLHHHDCEVDKAICGQRIALNLNIQKDEVKKGMLFSQKGILRGFDRIDCVIFPLSKLINGQSVSFFIGARRVNANLHILEDLGDRIFATLHLAESIFSVFKERFILRDNAITIGGGMVLNPITDPMKKTQKLQYLRYLLKDDFTNAFKILVSAHKCGFGLLQSSQRFALTLSQSLEIAKEINDIFVDEESYVLYSLEVRNLVKEAIISLISKNKNAIFSAKSINQQLKWSSINFTQSILDELEKNGIIKKKQSVYISPKSEIGDIFAYAQDLILKELEIAGMTPEAPYNIYDKLDIDRGLGDRIFWQLTKSRKVIRLSHNLFVLSATLNNVMEMFREIIKKEGYIDIAMVKKYYNISRKYSICYLDYLDNYGDIVRENNKRLFK